MAGQLIAAVVGTIAFSIMYIVPSKYFVYCGVIGGAGWLLLSMTKESLGEGFATMLAAMLVLFMSRAAAVMKKCPATIFLIAGIVPLVPGAGVYQTAYNLAVGEMSKAASTGYSALKDAVAIVLGIAIIFEIPQGFFLKLFGKKEHGRDKRE